MPGSFDAFQYFDHLRGRRRFIAAACGVAVGLSLGLSLILPKKYTATARIVIDPPASSDVRSAMVVSPIYLESLKTYLLFASSDSLFAQAADHFGLREPRQSIEALKRSVLKVEIPRDTKILEITASLRDPRKAQAVAGYLAEETVKLNSRVSREGDQELITDAEKQLSDSRARLNKVESEWSGLVSSEPTDQLTAEISSAQDLSASLREQLSTTGVYIAESEDRAKTLSGGELEETQKELRSARVRGEGMRKQLQQLEQEIARKQSLLNKRMALRDSLQSELKAAQAAFQAMETRLAETRAAAGYRGERLKIIDLGVVPDRPSSPNIPLNVLAALLAALALSFLYVTLEFSYRVGRTPWSAAGAPVGLSEAREEFHLTAKKPAGGPAAGRGAGCGPGGPPH